MSTYNFGTSILNAFQNPDQDPSPLTPDQSPKARSPFSDYYERSRVTASGFTESETTACNLKESVTLTSEQWRSLTEKMSSLSDQVNEMRQEPRQAKETQSPDKSQSLAEALMAMGVKPENRVGMQEAEDDLRSVLSRSTIRPNDSASMIKPLSPGTISTRYSGIRSNIIRGSDHDQIIGGYEVSAEDHVRELEAIKNIQTVYGLPRIFIDDRLNFLLHLHKPLEQMLSKAKHYPDENSLEKLTRFIDKVRGKQRSPHGELLYQVLRATIDTRRMKVRANPFNLPIVEIGMELTDQLVYMSLSELYSEYCTLWFHSLKDVSPPIFSDKYVNVGHLAPSANIRSSQRGKKKQTSSSSSLSFLSART